MKRISLIAAAVLAALALTSCGSTKVKRYSSGDTVKDLSGYWNETDVTQVCETLIDSCIKSRRIANFEAQNGRAPYVILGKIANKSSEHIDTAILSKRFQNVIINDGTLEFVADSEQRQQLREEKADQAANAYDTAKSIGNEQAADFMLQGTVTTIIDTAGNGKEQVRTYQVDMQLIDLENNRIIWAEQNNDIRKYIKRPAAKL